MSFHLHHGNILCRNTAPAQHDIPDLSHLRRRERFAGCHDGQVCPFVLQKAQAVGEAFGAYQCFDLIFCVQIFQTCCQLRGILLLSSCDMEEDFMVFWIVSIASSWAFSRLSLACSKNFAPESLATLTS